MSSLYDQKDCKPNILKMYLDESTKLDTLRKFLADLDRDITGYDYEEDGDDPDIITVDPTIDGYVLDYGPNSTRYVGIEIIFKRDQPIKEQWTHIFHLLGHYGFKIKSIYAYRQRNHLIEWRPTWDEFARGKISQFSDFKTEVRHLYGVDFSEWADYHLSFEWLNYMLKAHEDTEPEEKEYYAYTGSLGHDD